jgi:hypothetical protein
MINVIAVLSPLEGILQPRCLFGWSDQSIVFMGCTCVCICVCLLACCARMSAGKCQSFAADIADIGGHSHAGFDVERSGSELIFVPFDNSGRRSNLPPPVLRCSASSFPSLSFIISASSHTWDLTINHHPLCRCVGDVSVLDGSLVQ